MALAGWALAGATANATLQQRLLWLPDPAEQRLKLELEQLTPAPKEGPKPENTAGFGSPASGPEAMLALRDAVASYLQVPLDHDDLRDQISPSQQQQRLNLVNMGQLPAALIYRSPSPRSQSRSWNEFRPQR